MERPVERLAGGDGRPANAPLAEELERLIRRYAATPANSLGVEPHEAAFGPPLVGFAAGDDPLFADFKRHVGDFHWTPAEAFALAFPDRPAEAEELTVVSWVLPLAESVRLANRSETRTPARYWAHGKHFGTVFIHALASHLIAWLDDRGHPAVEPWTMPQWTCDGLTQAPGRTTSTWSERHAAYAAGLGTFGLSDGLITASGKAMRCGSIVARIALPPTPRPYRDHHAYCLHYHGAAGCTGCIDRCPVVAIGPHGHDKERCGAYLARLRADLIEPVYGVPTDCCGLCQTGVPCESGIPAGVLD